MKQQLIAIIKKIATMNRFFLIKKYILNNKHNKMLIMLLSCSIFFGLIFAYKLFGKIMMDRYFNNMPVAVETISTTKAKHYAWGFTLNAVGSVQAINSVEVTTEAPGIVENIKFNSGDPIQQGEVLIELNTKVDHAQLTALQAAKRLAEQDFMRAQQLFKAKTISKAELDNKQSVAEQAIARVKVQQALMQQKQIRAPFTGQLGIRQVNIGEYIAPGRPIVKLQSLAPIYVNFAIPEQELCYLQQGLEVTLQVGAYSGEMFTGKITAIEPGADPETRNFNIQATFANKEAKLRSGMFAEVTVKLTGNEQVIAIPRSAISYNPYGDSVYIVQTLAINKEAKKSGKDNREIFTVTRRFVKLGRTKGEMVEVIEGLKLDDVVATSGLLKLRNDTKVVINNSINPAIESN